MLLILILLKPLHASNNNSNNGQDGNWYKDTIEIEIQETKFNGIDDGYNFTLTLPALDKNKDYFI